MNADSTITTQAGSTGAADDSDDSGPSPSTPSDSDNPPEPALADASTDAPTLDLALIGADSLPPIDHEWLMTRLGEAIDALPHCVRRVAVRFVDATAMAQLHNRHCGIDGPTDVLTFPGGAPPGLVDADIAVCIDVAAQQASKRGHALRQELLLYIIHGVLHCAGYDDHAVEDARTMHAEEDRILTTIGVGVTFARDQSGHDEDRASGTVTEDHLRE